nr:P-loop NTPase fold protein [Elizabethkingia sp. ASV34]
MEQIYNSDKPINDKNKDLFNRNKFSSRISQTIINRKSVEGLVIGLYGIWGEGKTSVLNMIQNDLQEKDDIYVVKFNPWRFKNEDSLILNFLKNISIVLDKDLNNAKEKFGGFIKKYGIGVGLGVLNIDLAKIGEALSDTELEKLKDRVNAFLKESKKKIVITIDDIDRLDKQELFSLFKLIKLTGDFSNTYYILSFDDEMVASAIGERYASGDTLSGYNFLEKIIQVPLRIPQAQTQDLLNYTFELLNNAFSDNQLDLTTEEAQKIGSLISQNILPRIKTPRLAIRYANSLSFLIPLLKGEVNNSDLIIFEGIKIFYPEYYQFIKNNPSYFIESYYGYRDSKDSSKIEELKKELEKISSIYSNNDKKAIENLLKELFPYTKEVFENYSFRYGDIRWEMEKRIVSPKYFNRYFAYSVLNDEISDVYFDGYIKSLTTKSFEKLSKETLEIIKRIGPNDYLSKISFYEEKLIWDEKKCLINLIANSQDQFDGMKGGTFMFGFHNPRKEAGRFITRMLQSQNDENEKLIIAKSLLKITIAYNFSSELMWWFKYGKIDGSPMFIESNLQELEKEFIQRILEEASLDNSNIFIKFEISIFAILDYWYNYDKDQLYQYFEKYLSDNNKKTSRDIINAMTTTMYSSLNPEPYKVDFKKESYDLLKKYYDVDKLYDSLISNYKEEIEEASLIFFDTGEGQTEHNAMRQFVHWYNEDKNTLVEENNQ